MSRRDKAERYYYLSIDEKAVHKGHDYISILSDEATGVVIDVVGGRTKESVDKLCKDALSENQKGRSKDRLYRYVGCIYLRSGNF